MIDFLNENYQGIVAVILVIIFGFFGIIYLEKLVAESKPLIAECRQKCLPNAIDSYSPKCICDLTKVVK